ncbi:MAG TPA: type IV secretion system DNA-binding domain-containing protein [Desulfosporosinus sp.]|nr:type IV secretion system DNA-binding domain-containing protein [Desulfosporosinus sp.]
MKHIQVFEGNELKLSPPISSTGSPSRVQLLGIDPSGSEIEVPFSDSDLSRHVLFLGGIGTGKTNAIFQILNQLRLCMNPSDVMLIFDTKGDFYQEFYRQGDIVISNDIKATGPNGPDYWNIYRELGSGETLEENIIEITRTLFFEKIKQSNQPFFPYAAKDLLSGILLHFSRLQDMEKLNNASLRAFLDRSPIGEIREMLQGHDDLRSMVSYIADDRSPQTQGVFSELQQMVREILVGNFRRPGTLSVRDAIRNKGGKAIFIEYDLGIGNMLTPIYRLLLDLAIKEALHREKSEGKVWFIIDEFRLVPNLQHVDDGINFGRSLGASFIIGVQNVERIFHAYGEQLARSILSGFMNTVAFSVNDAATRSYIQGLFGKNRKREAYMASVQSRGLIEQVREANVVEDWDVSSLPIGRAIVGLPGRDPFLFQFKRYEH